MASVRLLTVKAVALRLGMSEIAARRALERGLLPVVRLGRRIRVRDADLHALIQTRLSTPSPHPHDA